MPDSKQTPLSYSVIDGGIQLHSKVFWDPGVTADSPFNLFDGRIMLTWPHFLGNKMPCRFPFLSLSLMGLY